MDLHFTSATATADEREAIDAVVGPPGDDPIGEAARDRRHLLLPVLHAIAERAGWISPGALNYASRRLSVPPADAYGVATFYAMFSTSPRAARVVHVCDDIACLRSGAAALCEQLEATLGPPGSAGGDVTWMRSPCLGLCDRAPAAMVSAAGREHAHVQLAPAGARALSAAASNGIPAGDGAALRPVVGGTQLTLLRRIASGADPQDLEAYRRGGGYAALAKAFALGADATLAEIDASKLLGRGGAAFPAARKLRAVAQAAAHPHYVVCNADESEPGTFKDRILMEWDSFAVVEALTIAGFCAGANAGFIYIRGEYPLATARLSRAIELARTAGLLGDDVMGSRWSFDIEIRRGAGAYICGEETALFNSIEGKRGEPRSKPPFPVEYGLFGKPTVVNNVETLANFLPIVLEGGAAYAATGTPDSTGTRLFCLSGDVQTPGLYEVPHGTPLGDVVALAGGVREGNRLRAILLGGAAGSFVSPESLAMPLSFEAARAEGATLGSGVVMLFDEHADLRQIVLRIAKFFREESCGQCVPCRVGTVRQEEVLERFAGGRAFDGDVALLDEIARAMRDASICGLGQTAANAVTSAYTGLRIFDDVRLTTAERNER